MVLIKVLHGRIAKHVHALLVQDSVCLITDATQHGSEPS